MSFHPGYRNRIFKGINGSLLCNYGQGKYQTQQKYKMAEKWFDWSVMEKAHLNSLLRLFLTTGVTKDNTKDTKTVGLFVSFVLYFVPI
jgi:hypothetical protein